MVFSYLPHKSVNPYELLAIAILRQAYVDILDFYKKGQPDEHEGQLAIDWIKEGNGTLSLAIHAIQLTQKRRGWDFGGTEKAIHRNLVKRIKTFQKIAEGKDKKQKKEILKAWQLMTS